MTTRITELEEHGGGPVVLRVEGSLDLADVELLERVCVDLKERTGQEAMLDLAGVSFLDCAAATLLARLRRERLVAVRGLHFFTRQLLEAAEQPT